MASARPRPTAGQSESAAATSPDASGRDGVGPEADLPPGYHSQTTAAFVAGSARCEFRRVYGPELSRDGRGPLSHLDEGRSYWLVSWMAGGAGEQPRVPQSQSYAQALEPPNARLSFARFSSRRYQLAQVTER